VPFAQGCIALFEFLVGTPPIHTSPVREIMDADFLGSLEQLPSPRRRLVAKM
jgi:hypothetical protein